MYFGWSLIYEKGVSCQFHSIINKFFIIPKTLLQFVQLFTQTKMKVLSFLRYVCPSWILYSYILHEILETFRSKYAYQFHPLEWPYNNLIIFILEYYFRVYDLQCSLFLYNMYHKAMTRTKRSFMSIPLITWPWWMTSRWGLVQAARSTRWRRRSIRWFILWQVQRFHLK